MCLAGQFVVIVRDSQTLSSVVVAMGYWPLQMVKASSRVIADRPLTSVPYFVAATGLEVCDMINRILNRETVPIQNNSDGQRTDTIDPQNFHIEL